MSRKLFMATLAVSFCSRGVFAQSCKLAPPACPVCEHAHCNAQDNVWECIPLPTGTACNDGDACTSADHCDGRGSCVGTLSCVSPGVPGAITGASSSSTGSYVLSWGVSSGIVSRYSLYEDGVESYTSAAQTLSTNVAGRRDGIYRYKAQACNSAGCSGFTPDLVVTVLLPPGRPAGINVPPESGPSYAVVWDVGLGTVDHYDLDEAPDEGTWATTSVTGTSKSFVNRVYGTYSYRVRACNASGCSTYTAPLSVAVITTLSTFADTPVVPPSVQVPAQESAGSLPGSAGVEGGAATYHLPIEVPPGRVGMQPRLALTYSSRNGNGVAGVGWSLSPSSTIYRCPRTLAQDGGNRTVQLDKSDRLCFDGQRLVGPADSSYGIDDSEYRTELDPFARITLKGDMNSWSSYFEVEHKTGRISQYEPGPALGSSFSPDVWYLAREFDRNDNCIAYNYTIYASRGYDRSRELASITYTGNGKRPERQCHTDVDARSVEFSYADREDNRTTYRFGVASMLIARLAAISTKVGSQYVLRYELQYEQSASTRRSLLTSVALCAGRTCDKERLQPTAFRYQNDPPSFDMWHAQRHGQPLGADWQVDFLGDLDGDGIRDRIYAQDSGDRDLELTTGGVENGFFNRPFFLGFASPFDATPTRDQVDFNNDGRVEVLGSTGDTSGHRVLALATATSAGSSIKWAISSTNLPLPSTRLSASGIDYNGDGIMDLYYVSQGATEIVLHRDKSALDWSNSSFPPEPPAPPVGCPPCQRTSMLDINGDGLVDSVFGHTAGGEAEPTRIVFFKADGSGDYSTYMLTDLGGPGGDVTHNPWNGWIDVNGDGLPDIYAIGPDGGSIYVNRGGAVGKPIFQKASVSFAPGEPHPDKRRLLRAFVMDVDADGLDELMVPNSRVDGYEYCGGDHTQHLPGSDSPFAVFCGDGFDDAPEEWAILDRSVFQWNAYKFVEASDGSYTMVLVRTDLKAPTNYPWQKVDTNGDGMADVSYVLKNGPSPDTRYQGLPMSALGPYISRNLMRAPDLLIGVANGLGATATWMHSPLSDKSAPQNVGCDSPPSEMFYAAHHDAPRGPDHAYFTSSMWAVARFDQSNGLGVATNKTCYRYQDAMMNTEGRGFQGFKIIVAEEQLPVAAGEDVTGVPNLVGCGGTCSPNNLRTTTEFHQEFPLTSKPKTVTVTNRASGQMLFQTTYWWHVALSALNSTVAYSSATLERAYETSGSLSKQTARVSETDAVSGEPTRSCTMINGAAPDPASPPHDVITRDTRTMENDAALWWLARMKSRELLSDFLSNPFSLNETCTVSGAGRCSASPPTCPSVSPSARAKTSTTNYRWYGDNDPPGSRRLLRTEELSIKGGVESSAEYWYDTYGNLTKKTTGARDIETAASYPPPNRGLTSLPPTTYVYSTDGYFRVSATNAVNHISSQIIDPRTGLITRSQAIQTGPITNYIYDGLGRLETTLTDGMQPVQTRLAVCGAGSNCVVKRQILQSGSPARTEYTDRLGRVVATGTEGFDGLEIITRVDYNERGRTVAEYSSFHTPTGPGRWDGASSSPYRISYSRLDSLGRPRTKLVLRDAAKLFQSGSGDATITTAYTYSVSASGPRIDITVNKAVTQGGTLTMSRTYDRRGKLAETMQHVSSPNAHDIRVEYFYDPGTNLTTIRDSGGNLVTAEYDDLGRKISAHDPDSGTWSYTWDGLGRLRSQKDARGIVVANQYDATNRVERRFVQGPGDATFYLDAAWHYDFNRKPGTLGVLVGAVDGFHRDYKYDSLLRPWSVTYHVPAGPGWGARDFTVEYGYDHNYSRVKAIRYPSGEIVGLDYDTRGNLVGETLLAPDGTRGPAYRRVTAMSERLQITGQTFGNGIGEALEYDNSTGMALHITSYGLADRAPAGCLKPNPFVVRELNYSYDHFLNVASQAKSFLARDSSSARRFSGCTPQSGTVREAYQYDELQRLLGSTRSWSGIAPTASTLLGDEYAYDDLGNISSKSDYGDKYVYGDQARTNNLAGPHAVLSVSNGGVTKATFSYDLNGNLIQGDGRTVSFDNLGRPVQVVTNGYTAVFRYAPDGERYLQSASSSAGTTNQYYTAKFYERIEPASVPVERTYVSDAVMIVRAGASRTVRYRHLDRLGSLDAATNDMGYEDPSDAHGYDAFGKPRGRDWQPSGDQLQPNDSAYTSKRGFTGHEHLDDLYLVHMNGRLYDYRLGRFLSVDPIISNPANSQSINSYSYVGNNPLSGVDPTGYMCASPTGSHICGLRLGSVNLLAGALEKEMFVKQTLKLALKSGAQPQGASIPTSVPAETGSPANTGKQSSGDSAGAGEDSSKHDDARTEVGHEVRNYTLSKFVEGVVELWGEVAETAAGVVGSAGVTLFEGVKALIGGNDAVTRWQTDMNDPAAALSFQGQRVEGTNLWISKDHKTLYESHTGVFVSVDEAKGLQRVPGELQQMLGPISLLFRHEGKGLDIWYDEDLGGVWHATPSNSWPR